jgi:WD40 repeat protein
MPSKAILTFAFILLTSASHASAADEKAKPKVNFTDNVSAIFQTRCNSCHNADKAKGGLTLETFASTMEGGGSGKVVEPGDPEASHLWKLVTQAEEPKMPPKSPKIPDAELAVIKAWIEAGAPETSGSVVAMKAKPKFDFKLDPSSMGKPVGPAAMPEGVSTEPVVLSPKANAIVAMAASPWAPLVAVAGHKQVLLYQAQKNRLVGVLPFPEGTIHVLKFSRNGSLLLAGGGRGGQSGLAVVFDVKTGKRVFEIGKEYDVVLAADISPDHGQVALGGPSKVVRVYSTSDGQLQFEMKKHTEWVTALEFSPDGVLLATGDRNNGLVVWEAQTGREFFDLRGHTASITDVSWRLDSNVVASAAEDGSVKLWEMENGNQIKSWGAHGGGVASARFAKDGRIVTTGRDRVVRVWDQNGGKQKEFEPFGDLALRAVFADDDTKVVAGDWSGEVRVIDGKEGKRIANLLANPAPIATRLEQAKALALTTRAAADQAVKDLAPLQGAVADKTALASKAQQVFNETQQDAQRKLEAVATLEKLEAEKAKAQAAQQEALKLAQARVEKANAEKANAEKAVADTTLAEKATSDAIAGTRAAVEKSFNDKLAHDQALASAVEALKSAATKEAADQAGATLAQVLARSTELNTLIATAAKNHVEALSARDRATKSKAEAPGLLAAATERVRVAVEAVKPAQGGLDQAAAARAEVAKQLGEARNTSNATRPLADTRKKELDVSNAAKAAAEKALADRKPAVDALAARADEIKAEVEALLAEQQAAEASKTAANAAPKE